MSYRKVDLRDKYSAGIELQQDMSSMVTKGLDSETPNDLELDGNAERITNTNIDDILSQFEVSYFHYRLLILCGLAFMNDAMEVLLLTFLSACAGAEFDLNETDIATLVSIVFVGEVLGTILWGPIADVYGRRVAYLWICLFITVFGFLSGLAPDYASLVTIRFGVGIGVGGAPVPFDLLAEFLPSQCRGSFLLLIEIFWCIGSMFVVSMASVIIPTHGWRTLVFVTAIPATLACIWSYIYLPESPRWLIEKGAYKEAEKVVIEAAEVNGTVLPTFSFGPDSLYKKSGSVSVPPSAQRRGEESRCTGENPIHRTDAGNSTVYGDLAVNNPMRYKSTELALKDYTNTASDSPSAQSTSMARPRLETWSDTLYYYTIYALLVYLKDIEGLFATKEMRAISIPITMIWLIFGFTYYGIILFITRIYDTTSHGSAECSFDYDALLINASSEFLGLLVAIALIDWFGRVHSQALFYGIGALSLAILGGIHGMLNPTSVLFLSLFTRASAMGASCVTW